MFTGTYFSVTLTDEGIDMGMCGMTMPTQSNAHDLDNDEMFLDTSNYDGEVAGYQWVSIGRHIIGYPFSQFCV